MQDVNTRRQFLKDMISAAGLGVLNNTSIASAGNRTTPLPNPKFYWGIGIENCWIAQTDPVRDSNRRLLDVYLQMQHYDKWTGLSTSVFQRP